MKIQLRASLLGSAALSALVLAATSAPRPALAVNECGAVGAGVFTISCGTVNAAAGITYGNTQTNPATSTIFIFTNTQASNGGSFVVSKDGVLLSSNEAGHGITVEINQVLPGAAPLISGGSSTIHASGFRVTTSGGTSAIDFTMNAGSITGGTGIVSSNGVRLTTTGASSGITVALTGGTITGGSVSIDADGFLASTTNGTSAIDLTMDAGTITGGSLSDNANGVRLTTSGASSGVTYEMNGGTITGGSLADDANGFLASTANGTSGINFTMNAGSITGGSTAINVNGVRLTTSGANSGVNFALNGGTITGGSTGIGNGVSILTSNTGSNIAFSTGAGSAISAASGNGVNLNATGGSNIGDLSSPAAIAANTINGNITSTLVLGGVGIGTGLAASATGGNGNVALRVGPTGAIAGTGAGFVASAVGSGNVNLVVDGTVQQTSASAAPLSTLSIPVGVSASNLGSGNVEITTGVRSSVTQVGHVDSVVPLIGDTEGIGISALAGSGTALVTANGNVSATGIGISSVSGSGTATATVGGNVTMTAGTGDGTSFFLGGGVIPVGIVPFVGDTVGAYTLSVTNTATTNLFGGNIGQRTDTTFADIGLAAVVLGPGATTAATINVGNGTAQASNVFANNVGLLGINVGTGATNVNSHVLDPEGDRNVVNAGGIGLLGIGLQSGAVTVNAGDVNVSGTNPLTIPGIPFDISGGAIGVSVGGGDVNVNAHGDIIADGATFGTLAFSLGGSAITTSDAGINIDPLIGMAAISINGAPTADAIVNNNANTSADLVGLLAVGIDSNNVTINNNQGANSISDATSMALISFGNTGAATINNRGFAQGNGVLAPVVFALTDDGVTINNFSTGEMRGNLNFGGEPLILTIGGGLTANNSGLMTGTITALTVSQNNEVNNLDGGVWNTSLLNTLATSGDNTINNEEGGTVNSLGLSTFLFLGDENTVNNTGIFNVTNSGAFTGFTSFVGLDNFNNADGLLNMSNGISDYDIAALDLLSGPYGNGVGDVTFMTGNFNGGAGSELGIDAFLGGPGADSSSDLLLVGEADVGNVTGTTAVVVNDLNPGAGGYNPTGILFAHVEGEAAEGSFFLANGPIDKGFFSYDILRVETSSSDWLLVSAPNDRAAELPALITGAQTVWYESTGVWLDRTADLRRQVTSCSPVDEAQMSANVGDTQVTAAADVVPECHYKRYGFWFRGYGGEYDRDSSNVKYDQDLWGGEAGFDVVLSDDPSSGAFILGILGGYLSSSMDFDWTGSNADLEGGTVGAYATYINGGWYADLLFKANILDVDYETDFDDPENDASTDALSLGARLDTGYRFDTDGGFFIEPQATLAYVNTDLDDFTLLGTDVDPDDADSLRGRLGLRIGGSWDSGSMIFEPFLVGSVWHEFEGDNEVTLTNGGTIAVSDEIDNTYGEVGGGLNVINADGGLSLFAKVDALFGGDIESISGKVGGRIAW